MQPVQSIDEANGTVRFDIFDITSIPRRIQQYSITKKIETQKIEEQHKRRVGGHGRLWLHWPQELGSQGDQQHFLIDNFSLNAVRTVSPSSSHLLHLGCDDSNVHRCNDVSARVVHSQSQYGHEIHKGEKTKLFFNLFIFLDEPFPICALLHVSDSRNGRQRSHKDRILTESG